MKVLLDTQILLWLAAEPERLSAKALAVVEDPANLLCFSVVSIWEIAIKRGLGRADFRADPRATRGHLLSEGFDEVPLASEHCLPVQHLAPIHKDPFDRVLLSQASVERLTFVTADKILGRYPGDILLV